MGQFDIGLFVEGVKLLCLFNVLPSKIVFSTFDFIEHPEDVIALLFGINTDNVMVPDFFLELVHHFCQKLTVNFG